MDVIQLHKEDLHLRLFDDVVFLLFSEPGAMMGQGTVFFATRSCRFYGFDYLHGDIEFTDIYPLFPTLEQCRFHTFGKGSTVPAGWQYMYLGLGHHLIIEESVYPEFQEQIFDCQTANEIYVCWQSIVRRTLLGDE